MSRTILRGGVALTLARSSAALPSSDAIVVLDATAAPAGSM